MNKVKTKHLTGQIANFPKHVVQAMCEEQVRQGNKFDPSVFATDCGSNSSCGGFHWTATEQGCDFWESVIGNKQFHLIPKPKGHPHAKLMKQYAKDAKTHERPWELWEYETASGGIWLDCDRSPSWDSAVKYRRKKTSEK